MSLSNALDRGYRDWTFGDPLSNLDLSALDAIIEAACRWERVLKQKPTDEEFDELITVLAWVDLGAVHGQVGEWVGVDGDAKLVGEDE